MHFLFGKNYPFPKEFTIKLDTLGSVSFLFFSWDLLIGLKWLSLAVTVRMRRGSKQLSPRGRSEASNLPFFTYKIKDLL